MEHPHRSDEWYTPRYIIDALGHFELDPCAAPDPPRHFADINYTKADDGLSRDWLQKRVFLNPPYSHPLIDKFCHKMTIHKNGVLLTFNRLDTKLFQDIILPAATAIMFLRGRIKFSDASTGGNCGSILTTFSEADAEILKNSGLPGFFINLSNNLSI